jgi:O-antigen ligase
LFLFALPAIRSLVRERRLPVISRSIYRAMLIVLFVLGVGGVLYGSVVVGRFFHLNNPIESRSLWERERDIAISLALIRQHPWTGVGFGNYLAQAVRMDWWAEPVHSVPLHFGAELGMLGVALWLLLLGAPLLSTNVWRSCTAWKGPPAINILLAFGMLGLLQPGPNPLIEVRSAILAGLVLSICPCIFSRV